MLKFETVSSCKYFAGNRTEHTKPDGRHNTLSIRTPFGTTGISSDQQGHRFGTQRDHFSIPGLRGCPLSHGIDRNCRGVSFHNINTNPSSDSLQKKSTTSRQLTYNSYL